VSRAAHVLALTALGAIAALATGCLDGIDPQWQLDHDRIVAVRATPPHITAGQIAVLDGLIAHKGSPTDVEPVIAASATTAPAGLFAAVHYDNGVWEVVGPDDSQLATARAALSLPAGAPVPLVVTVQFPTSNGHPLYATKTVYLGDSAQNPDLGNVAIDGTAAPAAGAAISVGKDIDVALTSDADPTWQVNWLSSCGTLRDDDEHAAVLHVKPADPQSGELAVVLRDTLGGVVWQVWSIAAM